MTPDLSERPGPIGPFLSAVRARIGTVIASPMSRCDFSTKTDI